MARSEHSTLAWRPWHTGHGRQVARRVALALVSLTALAAAAAPAAAQHKTVARSTPAHEPQLLCDTTPVKLVRRVPLKPRSVAAGHRRKVVRPPVVKQVAAARPKVAVAKAAGRRRRAKPAAAPRKPNCVKAAVAVVPTPEATQALVAALPWTAPAAVAVPEISPFSLPGTIGGGGSNAWALGLAGLSAFYFVGNDHSEAIETTPEIPTVTPEPASLVLLGSGLAALGAGAGLKRRRRQSRQDA